MRLGREDEAYEWRMVDFLAEVETAAAETDYADRDAVIETIADDMGIVLVGRIIDAAEAAWREGAAMV